MSINDDFDNAQERKIVELTKYLGEWGVMDVHRTLILGNVRRILNEQKKEICGRALGAMNYCVEEDEPMMKVDRKRYNQGVENCRKVIESFITPITNEDNLK